MGLRSGGGNRDDSPGVMGKKDEQSSGPLILALTVVVEQMWMD